MSLAMLFPRQPGAGQQLLLRESPNHRLVNCSNRQQGLARLASEPAAAPGLQPITNCSFQQTALYALGWITLELFALSLNKLSACQRTQKIDLIFEIGFAGIIN